MPKFGRMTADEAMAILNYRENVRHRRMQEQQHASDEEAKQASIEATRAATRAHMANPDYIQSVNTARGILNQSGIEYDDNLDAAQNLNNLVKNTPADKRAQIISGISSAFKKPEKKSVGDIEAEVLQGRLQGREKFGSPRLEDVETYNRAKETEQEIADKALGRGRDIKPERIIDTVTGTVKGYNPFTGATTWENPEYITPKPDILVGGQTATAKPQQQPVTQAAPSRYSPEELAAEIARRRGASGAY